MLYDEFVPMNLVSVNAFGCYNFNINSFLCRMAYEERAQLAKNPVGKRLFELMAKKRTNLSVAADVETVDDMLRLADAVGPYIAVLKTHVDVFESWSVEDAKRLKVLAEKHGRLKFDLSGIKAISILINASLNQLGDKFSLRWALDSLLQ